MGRYRLVERVPKNLVNRKCLSCDRAFADERVFRLCPGCRRNIAQSGYSHASAPGVTQKPSRRRVVL